MRKEYQLTLEDYLFLTQNKPKESIPFNNKNVNWIELGKKYGFDPHTIEVINYYKFTAEEIEK